MSNADSPSTYPYTGGEYPDRTAAMLVLEASTRALAEPIDAIATDLDVSLDRSDMPDYTLDIGFEANTETTLDPANLPDATQFRMTLLSVEQNDGGSTTLRPVSGADGRPLTLATGDVTITVQPADEGPDTEYGRARSPDNVPNEPAAGRAFAPNHEVRMVADTWDLNTAAIDEARQQR